MVYAPISHNRTVYASPPKPLLLFCICTAIYTGNRLATDFFVVSLQQKSVTVKIKNDGKDRKQTRRKALIRAGKTP
jgi:hypothetical protein